MERDFYLCILLADDGFCTMKAWSPRFSTFHLLAATALNLRSLVLFVIVDLVVPEQCLIPIAPEEVLRPDVLVWVLDSLFQRRQMAPVLPMFVP
jgi:hypothetical protein